jgi:hypothetical protein
MFVISRNGKTTVLTGWRAWLAGTVVFLAATAVLTLAAFLVLGLTITLAAIMLFVVPLALLFALLAVWLSPLRGR